MRSQPFGITLLAALFLAAGLAGIAASWALWPRSAGTSPLAALVALLWGVAYLVAAGLAWRRSRLAAPAFLAAIGLLLPLSVFIVPGGHVLLLPLYGAIGVSAFLGYPVSRQAL